MWTWTRRNFILCSVLGAVLVCYVFIQDTFGGSRTSIPTFLPTIRPPASEHTPCVGPRGIVPSDEIDDKSLDQPLDELEPRAIWGSYDALRLPKSWSTAAGRYGPYGWGEDDAGYNLSQINWESVNWADQQNQCAQQNRILFPQFQKLSQKNRIQEPDHYIIHDPEQDVAPVFTQTGQTAIVLRTWDTYKYTQEDLVHIRSLITEASLGSGGRYVVYLLVEVKDEYRRKKMHASQQGYDRAVMESVPKEFQRMTVLYSEELLAAWYPQVKEHRAQYQMYQGLQLFAEHFHYDHYWQLEMDTRFLVNARHYLDALSDFALNEPIDEAIVRASYKFLPTQYGSYAQFIHAVDAGYKITSHPPSIPEVPHPMGPVRPANIRVDDAKNQSLAWGLGYPADLILTNTLIPVLEMTSWVYADWQENFSMGTKTPRLQSPVSQTRCSRLLLHLMHRAQKNQGLALPSEAAAPSFAWWHGLKISYPPAPFYLKRQSEYTIDQIEELFNGGPVENAGRGAGLYDPAAHWDVSNAGTWHWGGTWPREIMDAWLGLDKKNPTSKRTKRDDNNDDSNDQEKSAKDDEKQEDKEKHEDLPWILRRDEEGNIWAPALAMHPVKTNT